MARLCALLLPLIVLAACGESRRESSPSAPAIPPPKESEFRNYSETGDVDALRERGYLRLLAPRYQEQGALTRDGIPQEEYRETAEAFVRSLSLTPIWVYVDRFADLIPALKAGEGDLIATNLTQTEAREQQIDFSLPVAKVDEVMILSAKNALTNPADADNLVIAAPEGSAYLETAQELAKAHAGISVQALAGGVDEGALVDGVAEGQWSAAIVDSDLANILLRGRRDVRAGPVVRESRTIAWGARADNNELLRALNEYMVSHKILASRTQKSLRDWRAIQKAGELRVITSNNPASYFLWRGQLMGFDYDLIRTFAEDKDLRISILVRDTPEAMFKALKAGEGDLIAASLTNTRDRRESGVTFSRRYLKVTEKLVANEDADTVDTPAQLAGKTIAVNPQSSFYDTLKALQDKGIAVEIAPLKGLTTEQIIDAVARGKYDYTMADSHLAALEATYRDNIRIGIDVSKDRDVAWVLRPDQPALKKQLDSWISANYRGLTYNVLFNRYFKKPKNIHRHRQDRVTPGEDISPFDRLIRKHAAEYGYDWRLITAQVFQESRFDPKAESFAGAQGLMQLLPRTAEEFGYSRLFKPDHNIEAGLTYLDWLWERFPDRLELQEHIYFTLAAYNAGAGHVQDARRLARQLGKDPDRWFGEVEEAMLLLAQPKYARQARYGYVRGSEPVKYVRQIRDRYIAYLNATDTPPVMPET